MRSLATALGLLLGFAVLTPSCIVTIGDGDGFSWHRSHWNDDGLDHKHVEELALPNDVTAVVLEADAGDVIATPTDAAPRLVVEVLEEDEGDGFAVLEDGHLRVHSRSGRRVAVGKVTAELPPSLQDLSVQTGAGDVRVERIAVRGTLAVSTGAGDVRLKALEHPQEVRVSTGAGDVSAQDFDCAKVLARTGAGDLHLGSVRADEGDLSTGTGDIRLEACTFQRSEVGTGIGDIDLRNTSLGGSSLRTGAGGLRTSD